MKYILFPEGRILNNNGAFEYEYHLKDHLGSVRVAFTAANNTKTVVQENAYYPFGATIGDLSYAAPLNNNRYGYTGQEQLNDFDLNWYDYIARNYNPLIGRFNSIDPLAEKRPHISPYAYCSNSPVNRIDPSGMLDTRYEDEDGNLLLNTNDGSNAIVTVTDDKMQGFIWSVAHTTEENIDSQEWNNAWKKNLTGFEWNKWHEWGINQTHSDASKRAMVKYWQTGKISDYAKFYAAELGAQWTDPELVIMGVLSGLMGWALVAESATMNTAKGGVGLLKAEQRTLQHMFGRHAKDFGVTGNWSKSMAGEFEGVLRSHMQGLNPIQGTYRGTQQVLHYYNPSTGLNVMTDMGGNLVGGWRLSADQIKYLLSTGSIK